MVPVLLAAMTLGYFTAEGSGSPPRTIPATGGDAIWLGHAWVDGRHGDADLAALVARIKGTGIRDLFVHDGPLNDDGSLNPALSPRARWLVTSLHKLLPSVRVQAWLGDLVGPGHLDLDSPATRNRVLRSARQALAAGFDGIHFDMEPVTSGDKGYLDLLAAVHQVTRGQHKVLSLAADQIEPLPGLHVPADFLENQPHFWSASYLKAIARDVDEVAIMTYDTGMPTGAAYSGFVRLETGIALRAMPPGVHLLIGLPAYQSWNLGHSSAETVGNAIHGVRLALGNSATQRNIGVSIYADFTATPADWAAYLADWAQVKKA
jgi:Glycosyl hydrolases family 18